MIHPGAGSCCKRLWFCRRGVCSDDTTASAVFQQAFIPRTMDEVVHFERDQENVKKGEHEGIYYQTIMGLKDDLSGKLHQKYSNCCVELSFILVKIISRNLH